MKLAKAIEILTIHNDHNPDYTDLDRRDAHNLALEALKAIAAWRKDWIGNRFHFLPGESYDDPSPRPKPLFNKRFPRSRMSA